MKILMDELRLIFTDKRLYIIMVGGPFLYVVLFGLVYVGGRVKEAPIMVVDRDRSSISRDIISLLDASDSLEVAYSANTTDEFRDYSTRGEAAACVEFPQGFGRDIKSGKPGNILVLVDGNNTLTANVVYRAIRTAAGTYRVGVRMKSLMAAGVPKSAVSSSANPIGAEYRPMYNAGSNYNVFILLGLLSIALQQVTMMAAAISAGLNSEYKNCADNYDNVIHIFGCRTLAHALIMVPLSLLAIALPFAVFSVPFRGSVGQVFAVSSLFVVIQVLTGFGVAGFFRNALESVRFLLCVSVPVFLLSGFTWPQSAMPEWLKPISNALPLTHFAEFLRRAAIVGTDAGVLGERIGVLLIWLPVAAVFGYWGIYMSSRPARKVSA